MKRTNHRKRAHDAAMAREYAKAAERKTNPMWAPRPLPVLRRTPSPRELLGLQHAFAFAIVTIGPRTQ